MKKTQEMKIILLLQTFFKTLVDNGDKTEKLDIKIASTTPKSTNPLLLAWQDFYQQVFGLSCDFSSLTLPALRSGFDRLLVVAQGITAQQSFDKCKERFACWKVYDDSLDIAVPTNERTSQNGPYAIWVRDRIEADEEHKNKSANKLKQESIKGITLTERIIYELKYFLETGQHLDVDNVTLCSGSVVSAGGIPSARWDSDEFGVDWCRPGGANDFLRAREVVSS